MEERVYVIAIKNLLQAEFLQVVPVSLLQPKGTICCRARDAVVYEISSVGLDPGQTRPSMGQVGTGRKVEGLTDSSVEQC
jgi:hypothetical protein